MAGYQGNLPSCQGCLRNTQTIKLLENRISYLENNAIIRDPNYRPRGGRTGDQPQRGRYRGGRSNPEESDSAEASEGHDRGRERARSDKPRGERSKTPAENIAAGISSIIQKEFDKMQRREIPEYKPTNKNQPKKGQKGSTQEPVPSTSKGTEDLDPRLNASAKDFTPSSKGKGGSVAEDGGSSGYQ